MQQTHIVGAVETQAGRLELRRRGERDFLMTVDGRVLMNSAARRSEETLGQLACAPLARRRRARVLIGGLGMGFTLRASLDSLPQDARVVVAEIEPAVVAWCRGPLAPLTGDALSDPRVRVECTDVAPLVARAAAGPAGDRFDAIALDLYEGPRPANRARNDPFFGVAALANACGAVRAGGVFAAWSEDSDRTFERRLGRAGFAVETHRSGRGGRRHVVYVGSARPTPGPPRRRTR